MLKIQKIYKFNKFRLDMEKREIGVLLVVVLGLIIIGFLGEFTGYAVNESLVECNIADFNGDGVVSYVDKEDFGEAFAVFPIQGDPKRLLDFNSDGAVTIQDANVYNNFYDENYGIETGDCYLRGEKFKIESPIPILKPKPTDQGELAQEEPHLVKLLKAFFKSWFKN
jgi:hypothetical protein